MAYEYGSIDLGIKNPFKAEGLIRSVQGLIIFVLGVYCLLSVQNLVENGLKIEGWITLSVGIFFVGYGLASLGKGLFQMMRFFAGRGVPTSLSKNLSKSEINANEIDVAYTAQTLEQMLQGRKNLTFTEPTGWIARMIYTIFPNSLFLPYPYRNLIQAVMENTLLTILVFACFILAWFSGTTGLTSINNTPVIDWLAVLMTFYLFIIWWKIRTPLSRDLQLKTVSKGTSYIITSIVISIFLPFVLAYSHHHFIALSEVPFSTGKLLLLIILCVILTNLLVTLLIHNRIKYTKPVTEVSELRDNWQESIHPQELFIHFETIIMANRRFKEVPNRVYREFDPSLIEEGSDDKGHFNGEAIQETQPVPQSKEQPFFDILRIVTTILAHLLIVISFVLLFIHIEDFAITANFLKKSFEFQYLINNFEIVFIIMTIWLFGKSLSNFAHAFWAEMRFESLIVFFQCQGTYSESKLSTGTSIYDSTRSENTVVRSSITPWLLTCKIISSCFAASGKRNLEFPRHIMEIHSAQIEHNKILNELFDFIRNRSTIAGINSEKDLNSAYNIHQMNKKTQKNLINHTNTGKIELDQERIDETTGLNTKK